MENSDEFPTFQSSNNNNNSVYFFQDMTMAVNCKNILLDYYPHTKFKLYIDCCFY